MMSVLEYAQDVNKTVSEILNLCRKLNISVNGEDDMLNEEDITELDYAVQDDSMEEIEEEYQDELIEKENEKIENIVNNSKQKKQTQPILNKNKVSKKELAKKKKEMYKHKEKLISNTPVVNTNIVTYKDGMTISDLAKSLDVQASELIKKLLPLFLEASKDILNEIVDAFAKTIEEAGYYFGVYTNINWYKNILSGYELNKKYDWWIAYWGDSAPDNIDYGIWQNTSSYQVGSSKIDSDYCFKDYPSIIRDAHLNHLDSEPSQDIKPSVYIVKSGDTLFMGNNEY